VAIATKMVLDGSIKQPGIVPPEDAVGSKLYPRFMAELEKRNVRVLEEITTVA
jgi:saccharopine dehydrogenase-like NADP-dependent oxidoreductase